MNHNKSIGFSLVLLLACGIFVLSAFHSAAQLPPGRLTRQEIARPNPLRTPQPLSTAPAANTTPVRQPAVRQTAMQADDAFPALPNPPANAGGSFSNTDPFANPPANTGSSLTNAEDADLENPPITIGLKNPPANAEGSLPVAGDSLPVAGDSLPVADNPVENSIAPAASPLNSAAPFAETQPLAAVPSEALPESVPSSENNAGPPSPANTGALTMGSQAPQYTEPQTIDMSPPAVQSVSEGTGTPGHSALEGPQTPHLTLQKVLPAEVVLDQPAVLKTVIQNVGQSAAKNVTITDQVPQGTRLLSTIPDAAIGPNGTLTWSVGNLDPNVQLIIEMKVLPLREGEIGSVASISYTGEASGRIDVTRPMLKVDVKAPAELQLGEVANVEITVSNPGTATATNIVLEERVPEGLYHKDGRVMQHKGIASLKPKESKKLTLPLTCIGAGNLVNHIVVTADGNLKAEDKTTIRASAPVLSLEIVGAQKRFLERPSDYKLVVANKGNASAKNVNLELALPSAVQFVSTNQSGVYEPSTHTVHWALEELPPQEAGEIELNVLPAQTGEHALRFSGVGENNLKAEAKLPMVIDGIPAITFEIVGDATLIEVGKDAVYEIKVVNRGTKAAENVKVWATLADGMTFVKAEGARYQVQEGTIQFEAIPQLAAKSENVYKLSARCQKEGDYRLNVQVISDDLRLPIAKEESTRVYR